MEELLVEVYEPSNELGRDYFGQIRPYSKLEISLFFAFKVPKLGGLVFRSFSKVWDDMKPTFGPTFVIRVWPKVT